MSDIKSIIPPIQYDFPVVHGEVLLHAFCVIDAESVTVRSSMPSQFSYRQAGGSFHSNTDLFQDSDIRPMRKSIVTSSQCRGGLYMQPSEEYHTTDFFSYEGATFGLDIIPRLNMDIPEPAVTICAFVPEPSLWGQLTGGWDVALRNEGFSQATFEDTDKMIWEVHCRKVTASSNPRPGGKGRDDGDTKKNLRNGKRSKNKNKNKNNQHNFLGNRQGMFTTYRPISTEDQRLRRSYLS